MKHSYFFLGISFLMLLYTGCAGNLKDPKSAPEDFQQAYYVVEGTILKLILPVSQKASSGISPSNIYFRERKAPLYEIKPGMYSAVFDTGNDMVLSSDPLEEYGNKLPQRSQKAPFQISNDEAVVEYKEKGEVRYFILRGIVEGDPN